MKLPKIETIIKATRKFAEVNGYSDPKAEHYGLQYFRSAMVVCIGNENQHSYKLHAAILVNRLDEDGFAKGISATGTQGNYLPRRICWRHTIRPATEAEIKKFYAAATKHMAKKSAKK